MWWGGAHSLVLVVIFVCQQEGRKRWSRISSLGSFVQYFFRLESSTLIKKTDGASKQKATLGEEAKRDIIKQELARSQSSSLTPAALLPSLNAIC